MFHSFFILFLFHFSFLFLLSFFFVYFCSLPSHSVILSFFSSLFVAGFSRLVVVCWGCCTTFCQRMLLSVFWRREKPWISGLSPAKHKPGMTPTYTVYIHTFCVYTAELRCSFAARSENEFKREGLLKKKTREERLCFSSHHPQMFSSKYAMKVCVALS